MNILTEAIRNTRFRIPEEILKEAFFTNDYFQRHANQSLDAMIREQVFERWVRVDMDMVGGTMILIPIGQVPYTTVDNVNTIMRIPRHLTQGRSITTAISVDLPDNYGSGFSLIPMEMNTSLYLQEANKVVNSLTPIPEVSTAQVMLIDDNTIMVNRLPVLLYNAYLRCIVANDNEFNNVQPANYDAFRELVLRATKAYCYNKLVIKIGETRLSGGRELGEFKEIVSSYSEAADLYNESLELWRSLTVLNDPLMRERHLKMVSMLL